VTPSDGNLNSSKYVELIDQYLWPVMAKHFQNNDWIFQEDNCPAHVSKQTQDWKAQKGIRCLPWPSQSPDINIIENA
jgi:hypothetical protein